jgi:hypothetical protein
MTSLKDLGENEKSTSLLEEESRANGDSSTNTATTVGSLNPHLITEFYLQLTSHTNLYHFPIINRGRKNLFRL